MVVLMSLSLINGRGEGAGEISWSSCISEICPMVAVICTFFTAKGKSITYTVFGSIGCPGLVIFEVACFIEMETSFLL